MPQAWFFDQMPRHSLIKMPLDTLAAVELFEPNVASAHVDSGRVCANGQLHKKTAGFARIELDNPDVG